jgi:hypothetical protein
MGQRSKQVRLWGSQWCRRFSSCMYVLLCCLSLGWLVRTRIHKQETACHTEVYKHKLIREHHPQLRGEWVVFRVVPLKLIAAEMAGFWLIPFSLNSGPLSLVLMLLPLFQLRFRKKLLSTHGYPIYSSGTLQRHLESLVGEEIHTPSYKIVFVSKCLCHGLWLVMITWKFALL